MGCTSIHKITPETFQADLQNMNSLYWCEYIGQADGNAYIMRKRAPLIGKEWKQEILFAEISGLDPGFLKKLEEWKMKSLEQGAGVVREPRGGSRAPQP